MIVVIQRFELTFYFDSHYRHNKGLIDCYRRNGSFEWKSIFHYWNRIFYWIFKHVTRAHLIWSFILICARHSLVTILPESRSNQIESQLDFYCFSGTCKQYSFKCNRFSRKMWYHNESYINTIPYHHISSIEIPTFFRPFFVQTNANHVTTKRTLIQINSQRKKMKCEIESNAYTWW